MEILHPQRAAFETYYGTDHGLAANGILSITQDRDGKIWAAGVVSQTMTRPSYGRREMNLPRTRALLKALGNPERSYGILQVAGTKGKGTAATACATMLRAAGYVTGLYTSPHLLDVRERIAVDSEWIGKGAQPTAAVRKLIRIAEAQA